MQLDPETQVAQKDIEERERTNLIREVKSSKVNLFLHSLRGLGACLNLDGKVKQVSTRAGI